MEFLGCLLENLPLMNFALIIYAITNSWRNLANNTYDPAMLPMIPYMQHTSLFNYTVTLLQNDHRVICHEQMYSDQLYTVIRDV